MSIYYTVDEIIDQGAFCLKIFKCASVFSPEFIFELEMYAKGISEGRPYFTFMQIGKDAAYGYVYVFENEDRMTYYLNRYPEYKSMIQTTKKILEDATADYKGEAYQSREWWAGSGSSVSTD